MMPTARLPVITWGGTLSIMSTHRGATTVFNQIIRDILENGNPMNWSLHTVSLQNAVAQGLVERINQKTQRNESREEFLHSTVVCGFIYPTLQIRELF